MSKNTKTIEGLMDGYNPQRQLLEQTRKLVKKWEPTGLLEGLNREHEVNGMSVLLENQARQLIDEASRTGTSANSEEWSGVALPLVRRIFGELAAQEFVSVQPMNLPSGLIFYLDFKYGTAQTANHAENSDVHGNTSGSGDASGGLYGAGKFGYSVNDIKANVLYTTGSVTDADIDYEPSLTVGNLKKVSINVASASGYDPDGVRGFAITGSGASDITATYPAYTKVVGSNLQFIVDPGAGAFGAAANKVQLAYHKVSATDYDRTDFEATAAQIDANPETDIDIPELDIALKSIPIIAKTRKLKAVWTPELAQDLNAYHSVDAEAELTALLSEYISMEIDLEILDMLMANASAKTERWSAKVGYEYVSVDGTKANDWTAISGASNAYTKSSWFETLGNKLQSVSNAIHQKTLRGGANFMVVSPEVATVIESIPGYASDASGDATQGQFAMGVQKVGALNNRFNVYKNPYMQENTVLVGFRGSNFLETGAVYAPYVPLIMTPLVYDPKNFTPRKGVMTRYAKKIVRPEYYGKVIVTDTNLV